MTTIKQQKKKPKIVSVSIRFPAADFALIKRAIKVKKEAGVLAEDCLQRFVRTHCVEAASVTLQRSLFDASSIAPKPTAK